MIDDKISSAQRLVLSSGNVYVYEGGCVVFRAERIHMFIHCPDWKNGNLRIVLSMYLLLLLNLICIPGGRAFP